MNPLLELGALVLGLNIAACANDEGWAVILSDLMGSILVRSRESGDPTDTQLAGAWPTRKFLGRMWTCGGLD